jgi:hypothetical protein
MDMIRIVFMDLSVQFRLVIRPRSRFSRLLSSYPSSVARL